MVCRAASYDALCRVHDNTLRTRKIRVADSRANLEALRVPGFSLQYRRSCESDGCAFPLILNLELSHSIVSLCADWTMAFPKCIHWLLYKSVWKNLRFILSATHSMIANKIFVTHIYTHTPKSRLFIIW